MKLVCLVVLVTGAILPRMDAFASTMPPFPRLTGPVVDDAGLLPAATRQNLSEELARYAAQTGNQLVVVTLPTLKGYPIDSYGYQLGRYWGIGQKGKNNGVLLIIDRAEHQIRIEVGYGMEGTLTDAQSSEIIRNVMVPYFKAKEDSAGILAGVHAILSAMGGAQSMQGKTAPHPQRAHVNGLTLLLMFFAITILFSGMRGRSAGQGFFMGILFGLLSGGGL
ncbi:MAG: TPM domain-containing protein, partial [Pseudomonadota bacterium]|nr:TPM domain-containing protein [Pseudomonadota bacterium]